MATAARTATTPDQTAGLARWDTLAVVAVVALAAFTYLWQTFDAPLLRDEGTYLHFAGQYADGNLSGNWEHPPLGKLLFTAGLLLTGDGVVGARTVAILAGLGIAALLYGLGREMAGRRTGLAVAAVWLAIPHSLRADWGFDKLDRHAMLDPLATALALASWLVGRRWADRGTWSTALWCGALAGLAASAKLTGGLVLVVPVVAAVVVADDRRRAVWQGIGAGGAAAGAFLVTYAPLGTRIPDALRVLVEFNLQHEADGHLVELAGRTYTWAPVWAHSWHQWSGDGPLLTLALVTGMVAAVVLVRRRFVYEAAGVALVPFVFLSTRSVALEHYRFAWLPPMVLLAVLGTRGLLLRRGALRPVGVVLVGALAAAAVVGVVATARIPDGKYPQLASWMRQQSLAEARVAVRTIDPALTSYLPDLEVVDGLPADLAVLDLALVERYGYDDFRQELAVEFEPREVHGFEVWTPRSRLRPDGGAP